MLNTFVLISLILCFTSISVFARDLKATLAYLPTLIDDANTGKYVEFLKAIDDAYEDGKIIKKVYPFERSIQNVLNGRADFHMPLLVNPLISEETLPYRYSTEDIGFVVFVLYTNIRNPITKKVLLNTRYKLTEEGLKKFINVKGLEGLRDIKNKEYKNWGEFCNAVKSKLSAETFEKFKDKISREAFPYRIETDRAHIHFFDFPMIPKSRIKSSLRMVELGRIDGFIFAQEESDDVIKDNKYIHIKREYYQTYEVKLVLPKGKRGDEVDLLLTEAIRKLKASGKHKELAHRVHFPYKDWQPSKMGW